MIDMPEEYYTFIGRDFDKIVRLFNHFLISQLAQPHAIYVLFTNTSFAQNGVEM